MIGSNPVQKSRSALSSPTLSKAHINRLSNFVKQHTGIELGEKKRDLIISRLYKRLHTLGENNVTAYLERALDISSKECSILLDIITTNKTAFFREEPHFEFLETKALPDLSGRASTDRILRCWSAACSSGEEPYSLSIALQESIHTRQMKIAEILATDISDGILKKAIAGRYNRQKLTGMPPALLERYFQPEKSEHDSWRAHPTLRRKIAFRRFNLVQGQYAFTLGFDIIFCRNVMIYFDSPTRDKVIRGLTRSLRPQGHLFISHSESINLSHHPELRAVAPSIYQKSESL